MKVPNPTPGTKYAKFSIVPFSVIFDFVVEITPNNNDLTLLKYVCIASPKEEFVKLGNQSLSYSLYSAT